MFVFISKTYHFTTLALARPRLDLPGFFPRVRHGHAPRRLRLLLFLLHLPHRRHCPRGCPGLLDVERAPEPADDGAVAALRTRPRDARVHDPGVARAELDPDHVFKRGRVVDAAVKRSAQEGFGRLLRGDVRAGPRAPFPRVEPVVPTRGVATITTASLSEYLTTPWGTPAMADVGPGTAATS